MAPKFFKNSKKKDNEATKKAPRILINNQPEYQGNLETEEIGIGGQLFTERDEELNENKNEKSKNHKQLDYSDMDSSHSSDY